MNAYYAQIDKYKLIRYLKALGFEAFPISCGGFGAKGRIDCIKSGAGVWSDV